MGGDVLAKALRTTPFGNSPEVKPLLQPGTPALFAVGRRGRAVLIETSGGRDISVVDERVHRIVDIKTPSSGESHRNRPTGVPSPR